MFLSISQIMNAPASPSHDIACMTTNTKTRKLPKRGFSVWRRQSQFSAALGFALEPFIDAVKPISHHGEDGIVGRRLSASHEFFGGMAIALRGEVGDQREGSNFSAMASSRVTVFQFLAVPEFFSILSSSGGSFERPMPLGK